MANMNPEIQQKLIRFQQVQQQLQLLGQQRQQIELQLSETSRAMDELGKLTPKSEVYKSVGNLLIKSTKPKLSEELGERKETLELRVKALQKQEEKLKKSFREMQAEIQEMLKPQTGDDIEFSGA